MVKLPPEVVNKIEIALEGGYDVEVRKNKYGVSVASVSKKVIHKDEPPVDRIK